MTRITPEAEAAIEFAGRKWIKYKTEMLGLESRIRARVEAEMNTAVGGVKMDVAKALQAALDVGATKVALRKVTSKNPGTVECFLALLNEQPEAEAVKVKSFEGLQIEWGVSDNTLVVSIAPSTVIETEFDRADPEPWTGEFELFERPSDGRVFIDPINPSNPRGAGVTEWLRADRANEEAVAKWAADHPQS